jgi:hypothetical protein
MIVGMIVGMIVEMTEKLIVEKMTGVLLIQMLKVAEEMSEIIKTRKLKSLKKLNLQT